MLGLEIRVDGKAQRVGVDKELLGFYGLSRETMPPLDPVIAPHLWAATQDTVQIEVEGHYDR